MTNTKRSSLTRRIGIFPPNSVSRASESVRLTPQMVYLDIGHFVFRVFSFISRLKNGLSRSRADSRPGFAVRLELISVLDRWLRRNT